jgi:hypothetical protein
MFKLVARFAQRLFLVTILTLFWLDSNHVRACGFCKRLSGRPWDGGTDPVREDFRCTVQQVGELCWLSTCGPRRDWTPRSTRHARLPRWHDAPRSALHACFHVAPGNPHLRGAVLSTLGWESAELRNLRSPFPDGSAAGLAPFRDGACHRLSRRAARLGAFSARAARYEAEASSARASCGYFEVP